MNEFMNNDFLKKIFLIKLWLTLPVLELFFDVLNKCNVAEGHNRKRNYEANYESVWGIEVESYLVHV